MEALHSSSNLEVDIDDGDLIIVETFEIKGRVQIYTVDSVVEDPLKILF